MSDEDIVKIEDQKSKEELKGELERIRQEVLDTHSILDRLGSDSRNGKPDASKASEHALPARLNRLVAEQHGAVLKLLGHCSVGGNPRG